MTNKNDENKKTPSLRNNRVHNIKRGIIIVFLLAIIVPIILYIKLAKQVSDLNKQVEVLIELHRDLEGVSNISKDNSNYAYASAKTLEPEYLEKEIKDNYHDKHKVVEEKENILGSSDNKKGIYSNTSVYLTFDDGPSIYSNAILDILDEYNVKATFFVIGRTDDASKDIYRRIVNEGHTLGMHSYSHDYGEIYNSLENFEKDFTKLWDLLYDITGYKPTIYRFPGGSLNYVNKNGMDDFIRFLNEKSIQYYDWNVVNGDGTGTKYTKEQLIQNVLDGVKNKNTAVVLMHDARSKPITVESLPELLDKLLSEGAQILPLDETVTPIQQINASSIE